MLRCWIASHCALVTMRKEIGPLQGREKILNKSVEREHRNKVPAGQRGFCASDANRAIAYGYHAATFTRLAC